MGPPPSLKGRKKKERERKETKKEGKETEKKERKRYNNMTNRAPFKHKQGCPGAPWRGSREENFRGAKSWRGWG